MVASAHTRNRASRWRALITVIAVLGLFSSSTLAVLAQEGTPAVPAAEVATETPTETPTQVATETPTETATQVATETPTQVATETATAIATETSEATQLPAARGASMTSMASTDDAPQILPNTDTITGATDPATLEPGGEATYQLTYHVTTPRTGTAIRAELRHADGSIATSWWLATTDGAASSGGAIVIAENATLDAGTFALNIIGTAPAKVEAEQTVSLWIGSTASTERGETETGVEATAPLATVAVVPPPEPNSLICDVPVVTEIAPGETAELPCIYTVNDPAAEASVTAAFATVPGDGWTIAINDGSADETAIWAPAEPLPEGTEVELTVVVTAPADAAPDEQATVTITAASESAPTATWTVTVAGPEEAIAATQRGFTLNAVGGEYTVHVQDRGGTPIAGVCYTVKFTTQLNLGLIGSALNTLGLMGTVNGLVNALDTRGPIDGCGTGPNSPTGVLTKLVSDLSALELSLFGVPLLSLDSLLNAVLITPEITPSSTNPAGYANPVVTGTGPFTLLTYRNSGVESTISYESLTACNPTARISGTSGLTFENSTWQGSAWESVDGSITIGFTAAPSGGSCDGSFPTNWAVHVSTSSMGQTDGDKTGVIPAGAITYTSGTGVTGLDAEEGPQTTNNTIIATGDSSYQTANGDLSATFTLAPPDTSPPGSYEGTITITTSASSD